MTSQHTKSSDTNPPTNKSQICSGVEALLTLQPVLNGVIVSKRRDPSFRTSTLNCDRTVTPVYLGGC
ncbi:hypothetical protein CDAR_191961 [Caerostris darwini]|uniref:Uncharacterized protein n=1 Tax=Caerostris darwini TaxID=1538125 RepID=A0AAV4NTX1_9ARAC|nr:hypothetical protein CDAR_191961 [Caerostris darwini]